MTALQIFLLDCVDALPPSQQFSLILFSWVEPVLSKRQSALLKDTMHSFW